MTTNPTQTVERTFHRQRVPGSNVKPLERAPGAGADIVMLDLEDAVAPDDKAQARLNVIDALGIVHADAIATACPGRMEAMVFGVADYAVSMQSHTTSIGGANPDYAVLTDANGSGRESHRGDHWHYALSRIAVSCRAHGLCPIDGPFVDFNDPEGAGGSWTAATAVTRRAPPPLRGSTEPPAWTVRSEP